MIRMRLVVFFIGFVLMGVTQVLHAQQDIGNALVIEKLKNGKTKYYAENKRVAVKLVDGNKVRGRMAIQREKLYVDGVEIDLDKIEYVRTKSIGSYITGGVLSGFGGVCIGTGSAIIVDSYVNSDDCGRTIGLLFGIPIVGVGVIAAIPGVLILAIGKKHKSEKVNFSLHSSEGATMSQLYLHR